MGWGARVLYLGPALALSPHRNATGVLAVALDRSIEVSDDPACEDVSYRSARSVLIMPNSLHHLRIDSGRMAFLYVDPFGRDLAAPSRTDARCRYTRGIRPDRRERCHRRAQAIAERRLTAGRRQSRPQRPVGFRLTRQARSTHCRGDRRMRDAPDRPHPLAELAIAPPCRRRDFSICSRPRPACRCAAIASGTGWERPRAQSWRAAR